MSLLRNIGTIASSSLVTQLIGAGSIWLISHRYGMSDVGIYALTYSIMLIGAQLCVFGSQLLLPKQVTSEELGQNLAYCFTQSFVIALPFAAISAFIFKYDPIQLYLLTLSQAFIYISENLLMREEKMKALAVQRLSNSVLVVGAIYFTHNITEFYWVWSVGLMLLILLWLNYSIKWKVIRLAYFSRKRLSQFLKQNLAYISGIGGSDVLAMVNANLPTILINYWFSPVVAGYFAVVNRFCLAPVLIVGNAVRNSIFSKWSVDFRNHYFNYAEYKKVRLLLFSLGVSATLGVFIFYPIVMNLGFNEEWVQSIPTSQYMLPLLFTMMAICPLTVVELVFGSPKYFFRIQVEQFFVVMIALMAFPYFMPDYGYAVLLYAVLSALRYCGVYYKVNKRAKHLEESGVTAPKNVQSTKASSVAE